VVNLSRCGRTVGGIPCCSVVSGHAESILAKVPDRSVDMIFTDPPYGHNNNNGDLIHNRERALGRAAKTSSVARPIANDSPEETARLIEWAFPQFARVLVPGGCCCCCCGGGGGPDPQFARWSLALDAAIGLKHAVVWDKGGLGMGWHYRRNYEMVLVATDPKRKCRWYGGNDVPNVLRGIGKIIPQSSHHPTEKPWELAAWFIRLHAKPGDLVLDPFCGSGSTLEAAHRLGCHWIGVECSLEFAEMADRRMTAASAQISMFNDDAPEPVEATA